MITGLALQTRLHKRLVSKPVTSHGLGGEGRGGVEGGSHMREGRSTVQGI